MLRTFKPNYLVVDIEGAEIEFFDELDLAGVDKLCLETHPSRTGAAAVEGLLAGLSRQGLTARSELRMKDVMYFSRH